MKSFKPITSWIRTTVVEPVVVKTIPKKWKQFNELRFWKDLYRNHSNRWKNWYYFHYFTTEFGIPKGYYSGKKVLDIGCGPLGSLEWAYMTAQRIGLDCLADKYRRWTKGHKMSYVNARSEDIPFPDSCFDVVSSFNSLDHVDDLGQTISEIKRVLRPGGQFLLLVDCKTKASPCEPILVPFDVETRFFPEFDVVRKCFYKKDKTGMHNSISGERITDARSFGVFEDFVLAIRFAKKLKEGE